MLLLGADEAEDEEAGEGLMASGLTGNLELRLAWLFFLCLLSLPFLTGGVRARPWRPRLPLPFETAGASLQEKR